MLLNVLKNLSLVLLLVASAVVSITAQKYFTKNAIIEFHSDSKVEKVEAINTTSTTVFDLASGRIEFACLINAFVFEKALMQEHFNENYLESTKYPKSTYKGSLQNLQTLNLSKKGTYKTTTTGELTMHGVTKTITAPVVFVVDETGIHASSNFSVKCSDYGIKIPSVVQNTISNEVDIKIKADYKAL